MDSSVLIRTIEDMDYEDRMLILRFISDTDTKISEHNDGCRINLDKLTPEIYAELVFLVKKITATEQDPVNLI